MNNTKKFIRSRRISSILPWLGILGVLILVFSLIMHGFLLFFTELGFIANFYYFIDEYNWVADRIMFDRELLITHARDKMVYLAMTISTVLALINTAILAYLRHQSFIAFCIGICFISGLYFASRLAENILVILHIAFNNWKRFYILVAAITIILTSFSIVLLCLNLFAYFILFALICTGYVLTYHILIELYNLTKGNLGGHKYFIDLPDKRFDSKFKY